LNKDIINVDAGELKMNGKAGRMRDSGRFGWA